MEREAMPRAPGKPSEDHARGVLRHGLGSRSRCAFRSRGHALRGYWGGSRICCVRCVRSPECVPVPTCLLVSRRRLAAASPPRHPADPGCGHRLAYGPRALPRSSPHPRCGGACLRLLFFSAFSPWCVDFRPFRNRPLPALAGSCSRRPARGEARDASRWAGGAGARHGAHGAPVHGPGAASTDPALGGDPA